MVALFLTSLDSQFNCREFSCWLPSMEDQFDFLNTIVAQGGILLNAYLLEDSVRTELPISAFDGMPATADIQSLEREWTARLNPSSHPRTSQQQELIELTVQRIGQYQIRLVGCELMIDWFGKWLRHAQDNMLREPRRSRLIRHYESQLSTHQAQLIRIRTDAGCAANRLQELLA